MKDKLDMKQDRIEDLLSSIKDLERSSKKIWSEDRNAEFFDNLFKKKSPRTSVIISDRF